MGQIYVWDVIFFIFVIYDSIIVIIIIIITVAIGTTLETLFFGLNWERMAFKLLDNMLF
jgi:hypothetical protein